MVYRVFVEKHKEFAHEASSLLNEARNLLSVSSLEAVRIFNRYDVENIEPELFQYAVRTVFSGAKIVYYLLTCKFFCYKFTILTLCALTLK